MLRRLIGEDIELAATLAPGLRPVKADPGQLEQVLLNLAVNARDAMPRGGRLTIETANVDLDEAYADQPGLRRAVRPADRDRHRVRDGRGDAGPDLRAVLHHQGGRARGPGWGWRRSYGIVQQAGGHVAVYSEVGPGDDVPGLPAAVPTGAGRAAGAAPAGRPRRRRRRSCWSRTRTGCGRWPGACWRGTGTGCWRPPTGRTPCGCGRARPGRIDLLVTDVVMPGMGGRELAERLPGPAAGDAGAVHVRVHGRRGRAARGLEAEAAFLQKPFTPDGLARKVREVLLKPAAVPEASLA